LRQVPLRFYHFRANVWEKIADVLEEKEEEEEEVGGKR
jgi:hypothetical protein